MLWNRQDAHCCHCQSCRRYFRYAFVVADGVSVKGCRNSLVYKVTVEGECVCDTGKLAYCHDCTDVKSVRVPEVKPDRKLVLSGLEPFDFGANLNFVNIGERCVGLVLSSVEHFSHHHHNRPDAI